MTDRDVETVVDHSATLDLRAENERLTAALRNARDIAVALEQELAEAERQLAEQAKRLSWAVRTLALRQGSS